MTLAWLPFLLVFGGLAAWLGARWAHPIALAVLLADLGVLAWANPGTEAVWPWIPRLGVSVHLYLDGLSQALIALTLGLGAIAVLCSWREIDRQPGLFQLLQLWTLAGTVTVFLAADLFLFFFAWEAMIVPMYFLIRHFGHEEREQAAFKFFLFTQVSGLFLWLAILALAFAAWRARGALSFDYEALASAPLDFTTGLWLLGGFALAFLVKLPALPFHPWLPDAHTQAPTGGSVILAGVLLKTGAYGLLRFLPGLFPAQVEALSPAFLVLGAAGVVYGAHLAFAQEDLKRLVAYSSISHMGLVLLGGFAGNAIAHQGAVMTLFAHGLSAAGLFALAGMLQERLHSRDMRRFSGLWASAPRLGAAALFFALATLGLPGLGNFVGEFLALLGAFSSHPWIAGFGALGLVLGPVYALWLVQRCFHGREQARCRDLTRREALLLGLLALGLIALGMRPGWLLAHSGGYPAAWNLGKFQEVRR